MIFNSLKINLNNNLAAFRNNNMNSNDHVDVDDTTLRLECFSYSGSKANSREQSSKTASDGCGLVLGLGPARNSCFGEVDSILKLSLSNSTSKSDMNVNRFSNKVGKRFGSEIGVRVVDEGSTSAKTTGGYMPSLLLAPRSGTTMQKRKIYDLPELPESSVVSGYRTSSKKCKFSGCAKRARGATALCISHGGGQRCQKPGCKNGSENRTAYCKTHGGGSRCHNLGCMRSAEGQTEYCLAHGGGTRCSHPPGCTKPARGKSGLCIKHGGGKRCVAEGCNRGAEGQLGLCISHGGGRRCRFAGCRKGAQGSTMFCKAHGGGKRCVFSGCTKGAEGSTLLCKAHGGGKRCLYEGGGICPKSVHGGTEFCVAHGGGKRCVVPGCTKSARGRTNCCVKHGGGKRCKFENCTKSAQGSTDLCKAHGGGRRCGWGGDGKCVKFARGKGGLCAAHGNMVQETKHNNNNNKGSLGIGPQLFHGLVSGPGNSTADNQTLSSVSVVSNSINLFENPAKKRLLIPPQVLVPSKIKPSSYLSFTGNLSSDVDKNGGGKSLEFVVPEGRVHGGGLLSFLGGNMMEFSL